MNEHDNVLEEAANWLGQGRRVALATVIETWGSAPRPTGSQLAIRDDGSFVGSVSGGCIEGDVVTRALETLTSGKPEILEYGVSDAMAWEVGLACGGRIRVMVEPVTG
ncbi:MAG: xanthine dehydrogenase [Alphaproteobacteria bacterium HGW-Alphaproteobacteria-11]|nr:MAG: xanthine dehydrogenase [Alphaproteobacteria bacterium HGW-Alphaproteobacteria-11]